MAYQFSDIYIDILVIDKIYICMMDIYRTYMHFCCGYEHAIAKNYTLILDLKIMHDV